MSAQATPGEQVLLEKPKKIVIADREYELQPLGIRNALPALARIMLKAEQNGFKLNDLLICAEGKPVLDAFGNPQLSLEGVGRLFITALGYAEDDVMELLAQLLDVSPLELQNPQRFPLAAMGQLLGALSASLDISAFLSTGPATNSEANEEKTSGDQVSAEPSI